MAATRPIRATVFTKFEAKDLPHPSELEPCVVLELSRYYPDPGSRKRYGFDACHFWDVFDITLSDGLQKMKFVLTADARLKQKICPGCFVKMKKFSRFTKEENLDVITIIVIQEFEMVNKHPVENITDYESVPWVRTQNFQQNETVPLASVRPYYMDIWTYNIATEKLRCREVEHCDLSSIDLTDICCIKDVMTKKASKHSGPLLVKVMRKSRLVHFVTHSKSDPFPLLLPIMVADHSGWCAAVVWNRLALYLLNEVREGSLLFLKNFRVKTSMQQKTKSYFPPPREAVIFSNELGLEADNPKADVKLVSYDDDDDDGDDKIKGLNFPDLESCFMTRKDLISVPDFSTVDVAGLLTFVGRVERVPKKEIFKGTTHYQEDSGAFFYRRWVHLKDTSLPDPIIVHIYSGEQIDTFLNLKPGQYLLCRHVHTNQQLATLTSSRQKRHGWLETAACSWLYTFSLANTKDLPETLIDIVKTVPRHSSDHKHLFMEGGFFRYPPLPTNIESLKKLNSEELEKIVPSNQWMEAFDRMTWRECHQLAVHACLVSVKFISVEKEQTKAVRRSPRKKIKLDLNGKSSNDPNTPASSSDVPHSKDTNQLGSVHSSDISELWPSRLTGSQSHSNSAFLITWQGLGDPIILNTIKPCTFISCMEIENFTDLVSGEYDSDLGFVDFDKFRLSRVEIKCVIDSARELVNSKFFLLLDVYTNFDNHQIVLLKRAFQT